MRGVITVACSRVAWSTSGSTGGGLKGWIGFAVAVLVEVVVSCWGVVCVCIEES